MTKTKPKPEKPQPARHVSFRLPLDVIEALNNAAASSYLSKTKVLELTLRAGLKKFGSPAKAVAAMAEPDPAQLGLSE